MADILIFFCLYSGYLPTSFLSSKSKGYFTLNEARRGNFSLLCLRTMCVYIVTLYSRQNYSGWLH